MCIRDRSGAARRAATLDGVVHAKLTARHEVQHDVGKLGERRQNEHQLGREDMPQEPAFITGGLHTGEESGDEHEQHQQQDTPVAQRRQEADFRQRDAAQDHHKRTDDGEHRKGVGEPHGQRRQAEAEAFLHDDHVTGKEQKMCIRDSIFPFKNAFRISAGAYYFKLDTDLSTSVDAINPIYEELINQTSGKATWERLAPYIGLGWERAQQSESSLGWHASLGPYL